VTTWPTSTYRWKDIATNTYALSYQATYEYADAQVTLTYDPSPNVTFAGHLSAANLKPIFAYQMKLVGKPTALWGTAGDDTVNEFIGYTGRWWRNQPNPGNSNDAEYEAYHNDPAYIFEGYLLFDFFVTDASGNAEADFAIDSSYHVLWWEHQRSPGACDSPILWSTVVGYASHPAYDANVGPTEVGVYAEIERLCTGTTEMPLGLYNCRFLLTEESFHQSGTGDGYWQSAMVNDTIQFVISDLSGVEPPGTGVQLTTRPLHPNPSLGRTVLEFALTRTSPVEFSIYSLAGQLVRRFPTQVWSAGEHQLQWDGRNNRGDEVPAGVYVYRLDIPGGEVKAGKIVLIR
jgi:hypothetical protein